MDKHRIIQNCFKEKRILPALGAYDAFSALIISRANIPAVYITGYGAAASRMGVPDLGILSYGEMIDHVRNIAGAVGESCIVIADADTGYGGPPNVRRTVRDYEAAGVDIIQLEDQEWPKRCGHMEGKRIVAAEEMEQKIRVAVSSRRNEKTLILARTDAIAVEGFDAAIERARRYHKAGAHILFVEAPLNMEQMSRIPVEVNAPCLANMVEGGKTPFLSTGELEKLGYAAVIFPISPLLAVTKALTDVTREFKESGSSKAMEGEMPAFSELNRIIGLQSYLDLDKI